MSEQPKPRPLPRRPTAGPLFTIVRCASCDWMGAGYGVSNCYAVWEEHADVDGCSTFKADVQSQPEWMVPW